MDNYIFSFTTKVQINKCIHFERLIDNRNSPFLPQKTTCKATRKSPVFKMAATGNLLLTRKAAALTHRGSGYERRPQ